MSEERTGPASWVVVHLEDRLYSLPLERVVEVVRLVALDPVPQALPELVGLMNYRGRAVPVLDLRLKLGLPQREPGLDTLILVVESSARVVGLLAGDEVEVLRLETEACEVATELGRGQPLVQAVSRVGDRLILVLDLDRLVGAAGRTSSSDELHVAEHALPEPG